MFVFEDQAANLFALIVADHEINSFNDATVYEFFPRTDGVDVIAVLGGRDDSSPGSFEVQTQGFHQ